MTAPRPEAGNINSHLLSYQSKQFDTSWPPHESALDALTTPPAPAIAAETSPDKVFRARSHPPVGADGNEPVPGTT